MGDSDVFTAARLQKETDLLRNLPVWRSDRDFSMQLSHEVLTVSLPKDYPFTKPTWTLTGRRSEEVDSIMQSWNTATTLSTMFEKLQAINIDKRSVGLASRISLRWCILLGITLRVLAGMHAASGENSPPRFGDFEAQRHWMEVTANVPVNEWYNKNATSQHSAPDHWPIDYPPLTAWHSYVCGRILGFFEPPSMELFTSRGYETLSSKHLMRVAVLVSEIVFMAGAYTFARRNGSHPELLLLFMLAPPYVFVDHAHFQFNCVPLGLILWVILCLQRRRRVAGAVLFCAALLFKQTCLYFGPAFFAYYVGDCVFVARVNGIEREWKRRPIGEIIRRLLPLALATLATFGLVLLPFATTLPDLVRSVFPFSRGIFQDYVANVWVSLSPVLRLRNIDPTQIPRMVKVTTGITLVAMAPSMVDVFRRPTFAKLLFALWSSSMSFYLFSWQVHEKAILLPLLPVLLLYPYLGHFALTFAMVATFSLLPLLDKDGNIVLFISSGATFLVLIYYIFNHCRPSAPAAGPAQEAFLEYLHRKFGVRLAFDSISFLCTFFAMLAVLPIHMIPRPERFPYIAELVNSAFCCAFFVLSMIWALVGQYRLPKFDPDLAIAKKIV
eukprot:GEMP01024671.1.p1 GENE.GEMP01024671.1~~GEMP01024671.1.p1  ORF type:complete len:612 (+),score=117.68 GEMP01024671.1:204-2039(+)